MEDIDSGMRRRIALLSNLGVRVDPGARILDFGCGSGRVVYWFVDNGYENVYGFDIGNYLELRDTIDGARFRISDAGNKLPFDEDYFDFIFSENVIEHVQDQAVVFRELFRVMRPGGHALHVFPARYSPIETHIFVPFGGVFAHRWYYKLWAMLGIRAQKQNSMRPDEIADQNALFFVSALNYVPNSCYPALWKHIGYDYRWVERELFSANSNPGIRRLSKTKIVFSCIAWLYRTFRSRFVYLRKPPLHAQV